MSAAQIKSDKSSTSSQLRKSTSTNKGYYDENGIITSYPTISLISKSIK